MRRTVSTTAVNSRRVAVGRPSGLPHLIWLVSLIGLISRRKVSVRLSKLFFRLIVGLTGCERESLYGGSDFSQNVHDSFADCNDAEIKRQWRTTFNCVWTLPRSNRFSPSSCRTGVISTSNSPMDPHPQREEKTITAMPTEGPTSGAAWLSPDILAILPPPKGKRRAHRNLQSCSRRHRMRGITVSHPADLTPCESGLLFTALDDEGARRPYTMDLNIGDVARAFLGWHSQ